MTARQVMRLLQREGVPAGIVASGEDLYPRREPARAQTTW